jgi:hypothetical protein
MPPAAGHAGWHRFAYVGNVQNDRMISWPTFLPRQIAAQQRDAAYSLTFVQQPVNGFLCKNEAVLHAYKACL